MSVHFVGVSGTGMGALAALFREAGHEVSGSDVAFDPPIGPALREAGVTCFQGYDAKHLEPLPDLVVVGNAIRRGNAEADAAERAGVARSSMSRALRDHFLSPPAAAHNLGKRRVLVVAGTHGKTTTSTMCAWLLARAGLEPGYFIGGVPKGFASPVGAAIGSTKRRVEAPRAPFVVEGDEYDAVYWDKQPKFLDYVGVGEDDVAIVTSIEHDHIDIYADEASYEAVFRAFFRALPGGGLAVCDARDVRVRRIAQEESRARVAFYALERDDVGDVTPTWLGAPAAIDASGAQTFDLFAGGVACGRFAMCVPGEHNVRNAIAAIAACAEGFGLDVRDMRASLAAFEGVKRRQELLGEPAGVRVYDDFAHHPTAVDETLRALRSRHAQGALWAVFEPRSATACRSLHQQEYARAFASADRVLFAPLGRTNIPEGERLDLARLAHDIGDDKAHAEASVDAIVTRLAAETREGDTIAILSNGAFGGIHEKLLASLARRSGDPR
jgi:UDP-N-acetylmuramate: L-alanyl-gamma-D-glutamyl-meso-diaminopimelate ligase